MELAKLYMDLAMADREIAEAIAESQKPHTESEHVGILMWEMDQRSKRAQILEDIVMAVRDAA